MPSGARLSLFPLLLGCSRDLWFLPAIAVPDSKQPLKGLDGGRYTKNCSALTKGDGEGVLFLNGDLRFKLRHTLGALGNQGHELMLRGSLTQTKNVIPKSGDNSLWMGG